MKKILLIAVAASIAFASSPASAKQEKQVTRTIWELSDFPDLEKKANEVCGGKLAMSDKLKASCQSKTFPVSRRPVLSVTAEPALNSTR